MDYCSHTLSLCEYSSRTPRSSGSETVLSSVYFYGPLTVKEFYLRVNIHPALFTAIISRRIEPQIQGTGRSGHFKCSHALQESTPAGIFGDARRCTREVIGAVYPQLFEKWGEKFKKYERLSLYTGNSLSFNAF